MRNIKFSILLVDGEQVTLEDFITTNTVAEDVTPITAEEVTQIKNLKIGESVNIYPCTVTRLF